MKNAKIFFTLLLIALLSFNINAQYKKGNDNPLNNNTNLILGFINPQNFSMKHTLQVSMFSSKYGTVSVTSYINSLTYKISDKLFLSADVELNYSPFASSSFGKQYSKILQDNYTGLRLSRLYLDYKISDNSFLKFEFRNFRNSLFDPYYYDNINRNDDYLFHNNH